MRNLLLTFSLAALLMLTACPSTSVQPPIDPSLCKDSVSETREGEPFIEKMFIASSDIATIYCRGQSDEVNLEFGIKETANFSGEAVVFLGIVEVLANGNTPQAAHLILDADGTNTNSTVFRNVVTANQLRRGLNTDLTFKLKENAPVGNYALVLQLFEGSVTDPQRVNNDNLLGRTWFNFEVK